MTTPKSPDADGSPIEDFDWAPATSPIDEQAAQWLVRLTSGQADAQERAAFARWRDADPAHEQALSRLRAIWGAVPAIAEQAHRAPPPRGAAPASAPAAPQRHRRWRAWALAASVLAAVGVAWQAQTKWLHDEVTASGARRTLTLPDGSTAMLSGATALDIDFDASTRRIHLARGEAYFDVQRDANRPFVIDAGSVVVQVIGTRFSIRRDAAAGEVTVVEGRVRVHGATRHTILEADQRLHFDESGLTPPEAVNGDELLAWRSGRLVVNAATLDQIAAQINRHRGGIVIVRVDPARQVPVNAVIDLDRVDEWFAALEQQSRVRVARLGPVTLIY